MEIIDNRFRVLKKVYSSEIANSYLAEDLENNDELVNVKLLLSTKYIDNMLFNMFKAESMAIKDLDFEGLPRYITHNEVEKEEKYFYIASKYIEGRSLKSILIENPSLIKDNFFDIADKLINILEYLENKNIKHKSISLENVLIDEELNVSLINIAAINNKLNSGRDIKPIIGNTKFMPNEQKLGYVTLKSDQYALGFLLILILVDDMNLNIEDLRTSFNSLESINKNLKDFINILVRKDATERFLSIKYAKEIFYKIKNNEDVLVTSGQNLNQKKETEDIYIAEKILETEKFYMDLETGKDKKTKRIATKVFAYLAFVFFWLYLIYIMLGYLIETII